MIYITGDTHGLVDVKKLYSNAFPEGETLTRDDYLIIAGDFGGIWYADNRDNRVLDFYKNKKYTVLFIDGNHENFNALNGYSVNSWNGGKVHFIKENIIHLMRGQVYTIDNKKIFTFGGGVSIDKAMRIENISWWKEEWPSQAEVDEAIDNLDANNWNVDYVITHAAPESVVRNEFIQIKPLINERCVTEKFLDYLLNNNLKYKRWFCGHYHFDAFVRNYKIEALYNNIIKCSSGYPIANR